MYVRAWRVAEGVRLLCAPAARCEDEGEVEGLCVYACTCKRLHMQAPTHAASTHHARTCMRLYASFYACVYMQVSTHTHTCVYACICASVYTCVYMQASTHTHTCIYACACMHLRMCMHVATHVHACQLLSESDAALIAACWPGLVAVAP